jgi:hypothetical protein
MFAARSSVVRTGALSDASGGESLATASKSAVRSLLVDSGAGGGESANNAALVALAGPEADAIGGEVVAGLLKGAAGVGFGDGAGRCAGDGAGEGEV